MQTAIGGSFVLLGSQSVLPALSVSLKILISAIIGIIAIAPVVFNFLNVGAYVKNSMVIDELQVALGLEDFIPEPAIRTWQDRQRHPMKSWGPWLSGTMIMALAGLVIGAFWLLVPPVS